MKSKSAKAVLISVIVSLVIVIAVSLVLLLWALPSGIIESMALSHFLTALIPILGVSLVMAISSLWIKAGKKKPQPPFDEDVIKEPSSYDAPLYGDLDADDYISPFKVKSQTPEDWDYIEEFEGLPEKQKKRILSSMKKQIERPESKFDDLSENYPFTESFDFYNVPFNTYAFDKPETPKITPFVEEKQEELPPLEEFPEVDFGEDRLFESPLAPNLRSMLFNPEYSTYKLDGDKVLIAKNDDFKLPRPIYRLTAAEGVIDFIYHKDTKEREPQEKYIAPTILWKMIGEFLIKLKPITIKKNTKIIAPSVQKIETETEIEKKKALATVEESIDAYALLSLPEEVKENPEAFEKEEKTNEIIPTRKYESTAIIRDDATTEEAFSSLMAPTSEVYTANAKVRCTEETKEDDIDLSEDNAIPRQKPYANLDVTSGIYDISYHEEFENESDAIVYKYDHSKKDEPIAEQSNSSKTVEIPTTTSVKEDAKPYYTEPLPENPLFSLDEKEEGKGSDPYTIKYTHDELPPISSFEFEIEKPKNVAETAESKFDTSKTENQLEFPELEEKPELHPFTEFRFDVDKPKAKVEKEITKAEQSIIPFSKNEVALKEFDKIIPFDDNREVQVKERGEIVSKENGIVVPYEKGEVANVQSSEVSPTLPPFDSFEFEVSAPKAPYPNIPKEDKCGNDVILSDFPSFNEQNDDYQNDLLGAFNSMMRDEDVPSIESNEEKTEDIDGEEMLEPKYTPNKQISEDPTLNEAYDALMRCGLFTGFEFDIDRRPSLSTPSKVSNTVTEGITSKVVYSIPEGREEVLNSFDSLPQPEEMYDREPLTEAEGAVNFKWNADTSERPIPEQYIAPTDEQIEKGEFVAKLAPTKAEEIVENNVPFEANDVEVEQGIEKPVDEFEAQEDRENSLVPEFNELDSPSEMYDKVLSLKHRESYDALPLPEKMPLTRAKNVVPFSWLEDKGEPLPEEEYIAPTDEQIKKGEFVAKLSPVDASKLPKTAAESAVNFDWHEDTATRPEPEEYIAPTDEQIEKGEFVAKLAPTKAEEIVENNVPFEANDVEVEQGIEKPVDEFEAQEDRENSLVPEFNELDSPSEMYDKVLSLKHRESYDALPLPEKMPLTRAKNVVPFSWLEDKGEPLPKEEYIAPTDEQIKKGEFVAKLSPVDASKLPKTAAESAVNFDWHEDTATRPEPEEYIAPTDEQIEKGEFVAKLAPAKAEEIVENNVPFEANDVEVEQNTEESISESEAQEDRENSLVPEFNELDSPSEMYDKVLSLKHRESYDALPLPEKMPLTRAKNIVPFSWLEDKGEPLPEEEYIAPTDEQIEKGEFVAKLSPVDISKLPSINEDNEVSIEEEPTTEEQTPQTFIEGFNDILEIEMSEARKFDYELTIARIISEKADDIARLDIEAMAFMEDEDKLCIIFPCQTKAEATELIRLIKDAVGDRNMKVRIAELRKRGITAAVFSLEIFR